MPVEPLARPPQPVVALADAQRAAEDFVILRTLPRGVCEFLEHFDLAPLAALGAADLLDQGQLRLLVRIVSKSAGPTGTLAIFDGALRQRVELEMNLGHGYATWAGREYPSGGLRVLRIWDAAGQERDLAGAEMILETHIRIS